MPSQVTEQIYVSVTPEYLTEESQPKASVYVFSYWVVIENRGDLPAQLVNRHWIITDGRGVVEEVKGPGVIGKQPRLRPGEKFEYTSFCPLRTATGTMRGFYEMHRDDGSIFSVAIPEFDLVEPSAAQLFH